MDQDEGGEGIRPKQDSKSWPDQLQRNGLQADTTVAGSDRDVGRETWSRRWRQRSEKSGKVADRGHRRCFTGYKGYEFYAQGGGSAKSVAGR